MTTQQFQQTYWPHLSEPNVHPFYAVDLDFDSAPIRFWTGYGDRTILRQ